MAAPGTSSRPDSNAPPQPSDKRIDQKTRANSLPVSPAESHMLFHGPKGRPMPCFHGFLALFVDA